MADTPSLGIPSGGMKNASEMGGGKESLNSLKSGCISMVTRLLGGISNAQDVRLS